MYTGSIRIKLKYCIEFTLNKLVPNQPLEDNFREERLQSDEIIVNPQDDLYRITWETNFGEQLTARGNEPIPTSLPTGKQSITADANSNDAHENETGYMIARDELHDAIEAAPTRNEKLNDDVSKRDEANEAAGDEN